MEAVASSSSSSLLFRLLKITGFALIPSSAYLLCKYLLREATEDDDQKRIPLYGEKRAHLERFIFVPSEDVGIVLGRHMRNLRRIEYETRTFLNLLTLGRSEAAGIAAAKDAFEDWSNGVEDADEVAAIAASNTVQFIRVHAQTQEQIRLVELAIETAIADGKRRRHSEEMKVPRDSVGFIIGKNGERVRRINQECRVSTTISQTGEPYENVRIEGSPEGIKAAQTKIFNMIERCSSHYGRYEEPTPTEEIDRMISLKDELETEEIW